MNTIYVENCKTLMIGRRGESEVTTVAFDFTEWATEFGSGVIDLYVKRFGDESAYPVLLTIDGTVASWLVTETDTNVAGYGKAEYVYRVDGKIAKSAVFPFFVAEDIGQPASEPPDPYESWLEQLTALGAETEANAQAAEQSAEDAAQSAQEAAESAASVEGAVEQAEAARDAARAAQAASESARDDAQTAQASAESSATAASGSATAAAGSASDASQSASSASASASAAGASATTASTAATQAEAAKTAAQTAAEDAQQAAQQAHVEYEQLSGKVDDLTEDVSQQKSAIEALDSLVDRKAGMLVDSVSGEIASFAPDSTIDNLLGLTVEIEPVQDLHGYDSPWPDGGGVNTLFPVTDGYNFTSWLEYDATAEKYTVKQGTGVVPGPIPVKNPILAGTAVTVSVFVESGRYTVASSPTAVISIGGYSKVDNVTSWQGQITLPKDTDLTGRTFTVTATTTAELNHFEIFIYGTPAISSNIVFRAQIELGSTPTVWHPYENICPISGWDSVNIWNKPTHDTTLPPTVAIQLGQTVYGGTLDATAGTMTVDRAAVDLGTLAWGYESSTAQFYSNGIAGTSINWNNWSNTPPLLCSRYKPISNALLSSTDFCVGYAYNSKQLRVKDSGFTDAASFKTAMSGVQLIYKLATPITITLDPVAISTISGQPNNVWADAGDVSVEFAADLKHYIDSKIAAAVAALS